MKTMKQYFARSVSSLAWLALLSAPLALGCSDDGIGGGDELVEFENTGRVCLLADPQSFADSPQDFVANQPLTVQVTFDSCLSSSCTRDETAVCEAIADGATVAVTSSASYLDTTNSAQGCTDDCQTLSVTCEVAGLPDGDYSVSHGGNTLSFTIPSSVPTAPCDSP